MNKTLNEIRARLDALTAENAEKLRACEERATVANQMIADAEADMTAACEAGNGEAYHAACDRVRLGKDTKEMAESQADELHAQPMLSNAEYDKECQRIMLTLEAATADAKQHIIDHLSAMREESQRLLALIEDGNALLKFLQFDVMKSDASIKCANGERVRVSMLERKFKDFEIIRFVEDITTRGIMHGYQWGDEVNARGIQWGNGK